MELVSGVGGDVDPELVARCDLEFEHAADRLAVLDLELRHLWLGGLLGFSFAGCSSSPVSSEVVEVVSAWGVVSLS